MALFGAQMVITVIMISVIQKVGPHFSFGRWLLCSTGLKRYMYPTDSELKQLGNIPKEKAKTRKGKGQENGKPRHDTFHVPRSLDITLQTEQVSALDVIHLRYYIDYQWLMDFAVYSLGVYILTEIYQSFFPSDETNLSMLWCTVVLIFSIKLLLSLTVQYFKGEESVGERSTCIVMGFVYLLISMMVLIVDENTLEVGLEDAYSSFNNSASAFLTKQGLSSSGPASKIVLKFCICLWCAMLGTCLTFPGLRIAKMHWDLIKQHKENKIISILLNISFVLPFILVIFWIKPIGRTYFTERKFFGLNEPLMTTNMFESFRIIAVIVTMGSRLIFTPWYLQAYLDMAYHRIELQKKEAGRITNVDLQKKIAAVFYYLCVATVQYVAPIVICLYLTIMYKTLGGYSWNGSHILDGIQSLPVAQENVNATTSDDNVAKAVEEFTLALGSLKEVFNGNVLGGLFGFGTWWCCFLYFSTTAIGMVYQSYFTNL